MNSSLAALRVVLLALLFSTACTLTHAADAPPAPAPPTTAPAEPNAKRPVFAHYMVCFFSSVEFYKQEIELAQRHGVDGFALNVGQWATKDPKTGEWKAENYTSACERMYEAAKQLNTGFKLFVSADVNTLGDVGKCEDIVKRFYTHPNQFRHDNKPVLSAWAGSPQLFAPPLAKLKEQGFSVCFVPFFYSPKWAMNWSFETVYRFFDGQPHMDGIFNFGCDGSLEDTMRSNANARRVTQLLGKVYMAGLTPTYNSANMRDWHGMQGYGSAWRGLINDGADWVELVTWSDYQEDSNLMPFRWPAGAEKQYFVRDESMLDVTGYYSAWFKSGVQPTITQDKVYLTADSNLKRNTRE